jgi:serine/threonine-protein kinase RsbW
MDEALSVGVFLSMSGSELEVKVVDSGEGLASAPPSPDISRKMFGDEDSRGMGVFLIQALVDEAEWVPAHGTETSHVRLVIRLDREM